MDVPLDDLTDVSYDHPNRRLTQTRRDKPERKKTKSFFSIELDESEHDLEQILESNKLVTNRFKVYPDCALFVQSKRSSNICRYCSKTRDEHNTDTTDSNLISTDAFGQVEFLKSSRKTRAKYIKIADITNVGDVIDLFKETWGLTDLPKLLISVIGTETPLTWPAHVENSVACGLQKIAKSTKPWVVTNGLDVGITEWIANVLQGQTFSKTLLFGVALWNIIAGRQCLKSLNTAGQQNFFPKYPPIDPVDIAMEKDERSAEFFLNRHHTHFLLIDTPNNGENDREKQFRSNLEKRITKEQIQSLPRALSKRQVARRLESSDFRSKYIPAIQIVVGGTQDTIERVVCTLHAEQPDELCVMPVVIVAESGGAAELIARAYELYREEDFSGFSERKLMSEIQRIFPEISGLDKRLRIFSLLLRIAQKKQDITIFYSTKQNDEFDEVVLLQLMRRGNNEVERSKSGSDPMSLSSVAQLELSMIWNRTDIAKKEVLKDRKFAFHPVELEELMMLAISDSKCAMVELLLESGFDIKSFDHDKLGKCYYKKYVEMDCILRHVLELESDGILETGWKNSCNKKKELASKSKPKENDCHNLIGKRSVNLRYIRGAFITICGIDLTPHYWKPGYLGWEKLNQPFNELFLWAVMCNMQQLAILFWKRGEEVIARALTARQMYLAMKAVYEKRNPFVDEVMVQTLEQNAQEFGNLALGMLDTCTKLNRCMAKKLLSEPLVNWGNQSCMKIAASSGFQEFIAHPVCQIIVTEKWSGHMVFRGQTVSFKVILGLLFFPVMFMYEYTDQQHENNRSCCGFLKRKLEDVRMFFTAPVTKFWLNVMSFFVFIGLFASMLLSKFDAKPSVHEWLVIAIVISLAAEEIRQIVQGRGILARQLLFNWWSTSWNKVDFIAITLFFIALLIRLLDVPNSVQVGRVLYALDLMIWILRLLDFFSVNQTLGPYVVTIVRMTTDVFYFVVIFCVFLLAYGVGRFVILTPDVSWSLKGLRQFFMIPYFQIYGEMFLEPFQSNENRTMFGTVYTNDYSEAVVMAVMVIYILLTNLLLVNLLIAVFNNTFAQVQTNSEQVWKWQWYSLVEEYIERPLLVPPFIIISHFGMFIAYLWRHYNCTDSFSSVAIRLSCFCCRVTSRNGRSNGFWTRTFRKAKSKYLIERSKALDASAKLEQSQFSLMKFEEECQSLYLANQNDLYLNTQDSKLEDMKKRTIQLQDVTQTALVELEKMNNKMNELSYDTSMITRRLNKLEKLNKNHQCPIQQRTPSTKSPRESPGKVELPCRGVFIYARQNSKLADITEKLPDITDSQERSAIQDVRSDTGLNATEQISNNIHSEQEQSPAIHLLSRCSRYPFSDVNRFYFPDFKVNWKVEFGEYEPKKYTSPAILTGLYDTDNEDDYNYAFNAIDGKVDRRSRVGTYDIVENRPRNPIGRTGIIGRGCLKRFGPNHIAEPIFTRHKYESNETDSWNGFQVLVMKTDEGGYSLLSGDVGLKQKLPMKLRKFFSSATLKEIGLTGMTTKTSIITAFESLFFVKEKKLIVYEGYQDDEKNTDNAWIETSVINYHDGDGTSLSKFFLNEKAVNSLKLCWIDMKEEAFLPEYQLEYLRFVAEKRDAPFETACNPL